MKKRDDKANMSEAIIKRLQEKGVRIPCPEAVEIGAEVSIDRISGDGVTIHSGCRIYGSKTLIMDDVELGYEAPVTVQDCQMGRHVQLKGGAFYGSTFLDGAGMGSGAQVREACLFEEGARGAHPVGLKQTILFPFVTLGSLINFCDCLMAGGTDQKNHSEVGSSYIHFNYTPNQDKATASLLGDVPRGVMLNQAPIFLGGQGGLVGPVTVEYGTIVGAGTILRKDVREAGILVPGHKVLAKRLPFRPGLFTNIQRIVSLNTNYISQLIALRRWYLDVRSRFSHDEPMAQALFEGAVEKLQRAIDERLKRLGDVARRMPESDEFHQKMTSGKAPKGLSHKKHEFHKGWSEMEASFKEGMNWEGDPEKRHAFMAALEKAVAQNGKSYLPVIKGLADADAHKGTVWLQGIVDHIRKSILDRIPSFDKGGA